MVLLIEDTVKGTNTPVSEKTAIKIGLWFLNLELVEHEKPF